ncbi:hypothetical protein [Carboxylicivirga taeanensis]|uniref:hypothetical protein n=1 Tax=Carboxylicivirga taeanensis TaxID=1416875 RepID=UPI003F6E2576
MKLRFLTSLIVLLACYTIEAQMTPAKKIQPKVIKGVGLKASVDDVWTVLVQPEKYNEWIANIEQFSCEGNQEGAQLSFSIPTDGSREQKLTYVSRELRTVAYFITQSAYHNEDFVYRFIVGKDEEQSYLQFEAIFSTGSKTTDANMQKLVEQEWELIKQGLQKRFN